MLVSLAQPVEGELLYSVLARTRDMLRPVSDRTFLRVALGRRVDVIETARPASFRRLVPLLDRDAATAFARAHTNLNYHSHWLGPAAVAGLLDDMLRPGPAGAKRSADPSRGAAPRHRTLTFCRECAREDMLSAGTPCWRVRHQLPGVYFCATHGIPLLASDVDAVSQTRLVTCPSDRIADAPELGCVFLASQALKLSRLSGALNARAAVPSGGAGMQVAMRKLMAERGWLGPNGMARPGMLQAVEAKYGADRLGAFGLRLARQRGAHEMQSLWGRTANPRGPTFWGVLMLDFLDAGADEFLDACASRAEEPSRAATRPPNPRPKTLARHRVALLGATSGDPAPDRAEIRLRVGRSYDYLRLNDPEWLDARLPPRRYAARHLDWEAEDAVVALRVPEAYGRVVDAGGRQAPSFSAVAAELGMRSKLCREARRLRCTTRLVRSLTGWSGQAAVAPRASRGQAGTSTTSGHARPLTHATRARGGE